MKKGESIMLFKDRERKVKEGMAKLLKRISGDLWKVRIIKNNQKVFRTIREEKKLEGVL